MSDLNLGQLITGEAGRDAIHVAVAPVIAAETLAPGMHIGFVSGNTEIVGTFCEPIGIVDPFFKGTILKGQKFYMYLYPQSITSLRHEWTHPAFEPGYVPPPKVDTSKTVAEEWLRDFFERLGQTFDAGISALEDGLEDGSICFWDDFD